MSDGRLLNHLDPDDLALLALDEPIGSEAVEHVERCHKCREELADLKRIVALGRGAGVDYLEIAPPSSVWDSIARGLQRDGSPREPSGVSSLAARRSRSPRLARFPLLAAAVVGILLGAGAVAALDAFRSEPAVMASASMGPVPGGPEGPQSGLAEVVIVDGVTMLSVTTSDLAEPEGFHEVWLLNPASGGMIAMGVVPAGSRGAMLPVPAGVDLTNYSAVDISDEPFDGNPDHSSVSVLRGDLTA